MKDIICKEFDENMELGYQGDLLSKVRVDFFLPVSFQIINETGRIVGFFDISETDEYRMQYDGGEAPYIATKLARGMMDAMDYYIMPEDYILRRDVMRVGRKGEIRLLFIPNVNKDIKYSSATGYIRKKIVRLLLELYPKEGIAYSATLDETLAVLKDGTLSIDTCLRKLENIKEEVYLLKREKAWGGIDFSA